MSRGRAHASSAASTHQNNVTVSRRCPTVESRGTPNKFSPADGTASNDGLWRKYDEKIRLRWSNEAMIVVWVGLSDSITTRPLTVIFADFSVSSIDSLTFIKKKTFISSISILFSSNLKSKRQKQILLPAGFQIPTEKFGAPAAAAPQSEGSRVRFPERENFYCTK